MIHEMKIEHNLVHEKKMFIFISVRVYEIFMFFTIFTVQLMFEIISTVHTSIHLIKEYSWQARYLQKKVTAANETGWFSRTLTVVIFEWMNIHTQPQRLTFSIPFS